MMLEEVTPVPKAELPLAAFRAHLRMGSGFGEETLQDSVLESLLRAAIKAVEARTGKALIAREHMLSLEAWSRAESQDFPIAPVGVVMSVTLTDANDVSTTLSDQMWRLRPDTHVPQLVARKAMLPRIGGGSAEILFVAGYGGWADVPDDLKQAVMMLAAHYYENRDKVHLNEGCVPFGVTALLESYRRLRLSLRAGQ